MKIDEALYQIKQRIKMHELKKTTNSVNEREKAILDYITNLQEENERLKEIVENLTTMTVCGDRKQIKNTAQYKLDIYKLRIDKAVEYIINHTQSTAHLEMDTKSIKQLLDILRGDE